MFPFLKNVGFLSDLFYWEDTLDRWDEQLRNPKEFSWHISVEVIFLLFIPVFLYLIFMRVGYAGDDTIDFGHFQIPLSGLSALRLYQNERESYKTEQSWQYENPEGNISIITANQFVPAAGKSQGSSLLKKRISTSIVVSYPETNELSEAKKSFAAHQEKFLKLFKKPLSTSEKSETNEMRSVWQKANELFVLSLENTSLKNSTSKSNPQYQITYRLFDKRNTDTFNRPQACLYLNCISIPFTKYYFVLR